MDRLNCHSCIRYLLPYPINNLSYILFFYSLLSYFVLSFPNLFTWWCVLFSFQYLFGSLKTYKQVCLYLCVVFFNTLIYRYIAIVYVYKYVWKQEILKNRKPVRKRIEFVTFLFFFESLYIIVLSASFFFKIYCLLVCLVDSCSFDIKHSCFFVSW